MQLLRRLQVQAQLPSLCPFQLLHQLQAPCRPMQPLQLLLQMRCKSLMPHKHVSHLQELFQAHSLICKSVRRRLAGRVLKAPQLLSQLQASWQATKPSELVPRLLSTLLMAHQHLSGFWTASASAQ